MSTVLHRRGSSSEKRERERERERYRVRSFVPAMITCSFSINHVRCPT